MKIYNIVQGPFQACEVEGYPEDANFFLVVCQVEQDDGSLEEEDVAFPTWSLAIDLVNHFKQQIIPYEIQN